MNNIEIYTNCHKCSTDINVHDLSSSGIRYNYHAVYLCMPCAYRYVDKLMKFQDLFFQPERSKREDSNCCIKLEKFNRLRQVILDENIDCGEWHKDYADIVEVFSELIQECEMRCSEHCGNTVRDK